MKKSLMVFLAALTAVMVNMSCSDDDDNNGNNGNPIRTEATGTFTGTFTRVQDGAAVPDTAYAEGSMTITPTGDHTADISYDCSDFNINHESVANICNSNDGCAFSNNLSSNPFGAPFFGRVENNVAESHLKLKIRSGRVTKTYNIIFDGVKSKKPAGE